VLASIVIVLREFVEATFLTALLLNVALRLGLGLRWLWLGGLCGLLLVALVGQALPAITQSLGGVGQEWAWAGMLGVQVWLLVALALLLCRGRPPQRLWRWQALMVLALSASLTREGSEIYIYLVAASHLGPQALPVVMGAAVGAGLGLCVGVLIFFALWLSPGGLKLSLGALVLVAAGLHMQVAANLIQAGVLPDGPALWNSASWLPETSLLGQAAFSLLGYEASPSAFGLGFYAAPVVLVLAYGVWRRRQGQL
jgi:high-affinity iron transporter